MNHIFHNLTDQTTFDDHVYNYSDPVGSVAVLAPTVAHTISTTLSRSRTKHVQPDYMRLVREHADLIQEGKTAEEIALWTGEKLDIPSWNQEKFLGKRAVLPAPKRLEERQRFQKFVQVLGVTYSHNTSLAYENANGPSVGQPQYFLLDGFVQNAWLGEHNMLKRDKRLIKMDHALQHLKDEKTRGAYLSQHIGLAIRDDWSNLNIGYRSPLKSSGYVGGVSIGGSIHKKEDGTMTKMVNTLGVTAAHSEYYENTAAAGRLCFLR